MAEVLGVGSALITFIIAAIHSTQALHETVRSYQNHSKDLRQLREQLEALESVLKSVQNIADEGKSSLKALELPLQRCNDACKDFEAVLVKYSSRYGGTKISIRDWARFKFMGSDIRGFADTLSGYKSTIAIALGDANLCVNCLRSLMHLLTLFGSRSVKVTQDALDEYNALIKNTTLDLQERLDSIDDKLQQLQDKEVSTDDVDLNSWQQERESTLQCLQICTEALSHLEESQNKMPAASNKAHVITISALTECTQKLNQASSKLNTRLNKVNSHVKSLGLEGSDIEKLEEDFKAVQQCLDICSNASEQASHVRVHHFEQVKAEDDGSQFFVSSLGDLLNVKNVVAGNRAAQVFGSMSDQSIQKISGDRFSAQIPIINQQSRGKFEGKYGNGHKLNEKDI